MVLPIGCLRGDRDRPATSASTAPSIRRSPTRRPSSGFAGFGSLNGRGGRRRELTADVDHVAWLLGVNFTVQLVPAAGEQVMHVLAGQSDSVRRRGRELYHAAWDWPAHERASLVVAAIEGGRRPADVGKRGPGAARGRALRRGGRRDRRLLRSGGPARPGHAAPGLRVVARGGPAARRQGAAGRCPCRPPSSPMPWISNKVYLLSRLDPSVVEELGHGSDRRRRTSWPGSPGGIASCMLAFQCPVRDGGEGG